MSHSRITRSTTGCTLCRLRKVRCDERPNACYNCEKSSLTCPGYAEKAQTMSLVTREAAKPPESSLRGYTSAGTKRKRHSEACIECRRLKERCSAERPACARCQRTGKGCQYKSQDVALVSTNNWQSHTSLGNNQEYMFLPEKETIQRLWEIFFQYISPLQCLAFVHKPTMMEELDRLPFERSQDTALWLAICVLGTTATMFDERLHMEADWEEQGKIWFKRVSVLINHDMPGITIKNLMCLVLLIEYALRRELYDQAFLMAGTASRMTQALQLNLERDNDLLSLCSKPDSISVLEKETRRRLMWAIYIVDANIASGVGQLRVITAKDLKVQLPTHDHNFLHQIPARTEFLQEYTDGLSPPTAHGNPQNTQMSQMGLQAYFIRMRYLKSQILSYIKDTTSFSPPWDHQSMFHKLVDNLDQLCADLPPSTQYVSTSIRLHQGSANLAAFYALHLGIDQCYCDIYRLSIPQVCFPVKPIAELFANAPPDFMESTRYRLFNHARHQSVLIGDLVRLQDDYAFADWGIGIHAHEAIKYQVIYIMTATWDEAKRDSVIVEMIPSVEDSFRVLQRLSTYYGPMASKFLLSLFKLLVDYNFPVDVLSTYLTRTTIPHPETDNNAETNSNFYTSASDTDNDPIADTSHNSVDVTLHPLSLFALVRSMLNPREKHVPEKTSRRGGGSSSASSAIVPQTASLIRSTQDNELDDLNQGAEDIIYDVADWDKLLGEFDFSQQVFPGDFPGCLFPEREV